MSELFGRELEELHGPVRSNLSGQPLEIAAGPSTDLFCPPDGGDATLNAPALLLGAQPGDFVLSARIESDLQATFDAGALILWHDSENWAKLAIELSPRRQATVVTVVTRTRSDDCNSIALPQADAQLRLARVGDAFAFHVRIDDHWSLVRHFSLNTSQVRPGFLAQSPTGRGCAARFGQIAYEARRLDDLRDGT
jgi:regulation of enolase protein 1 (concanavalin A-like superfamily)